MVPTVRQHRKGDLKNNMLCTVFVVWEESL
jgi:hypothetical protein